MILTQGLTTMSDKIEFLLKYGTAKHINTIVRAPWLHGIDNKEWAITMALSNPMCPREIVDHTAKHGVLFFGKALAARHPNLSPELHQKALQDPDFDIRLAAWHNPQTTNEQLQYAVDNDIHSHGALNARAILKDRQK